MKDINTIYLNRGPGSFAGIRNSFSIVKAFNLTNNIDYYCYSIQDFKGEKDIKYENIPNLCDKFNIKNDEPIFFECRTIAMKRCITNLLNNACSYGNNINVSLDKKKDIISISIEDDGPGINKKDYDVFFDDIFIIYYIM